MKIHQRIKNLGLLLCAVAALLTVAVMPTFAAEEKPKPKILFTNVHVFDGEKERLIENANVLVEGNLITQISTDTISANGATVIDGEGRTLMPGIIDSHAHVAFASLPQAELMFGQHAYNQLFAADQLEKMLMRGVTAVRDMAAIPSA